MSATEDQAEIIQYVPFMSFVHPSFWHTLTDLKLDIDKLNEDLKEINGRFTYRDDLGSVFEVDGTSFNSTPNNEHYYQNVTGTIMNKNTIEDFKSIDKAAFLNTIGGTIWANVRRGTWISNPSSLLHFFILSFADLKKYNYFYWFAFPAPSQPTLYLKEKSTSINTHFVTNQLETLNEQFKELDEKQRSFFVVIKEDNKITVSPLSTVLHNKDQDLNINLSKTYFAFLDPSNNSNPGWSLRLFLAALFDYYPKLATEDLQIIGLRYSPNGSIKNSVIFTLKASEKLQSVETAGWVGWERNDKGNFGPKLANMSASMDPAKKVTIAVILCTCLELLATNQGLNAQSGGRLAETSSDLNIKLMKWRLVPDLNIDVIKSTKCLLFGAGTLGCHVARNLLAWGFRHITFIDNGKVSYSNPTRQVLFNHQDCLSGGKRKATAAADNLKLILPNVQSKGIVAHIPMPGHPVGESLKKETISEIQLIEDAIKEHDVIFLLLDTREARWLPTLLAAYYGKITINAALGFDSYLVMRHGIYTPNFCSETSLTSAILPGGSLGCYFCNDVTAPGDSIRDRTLDLQCTVTRPGVAAIAGAYAVEILVGLLQHPLRVEAPAVYNLSAKTNIPEDALGLLGPIPHSIRGFIHLYQTIMPSCSKFTQCIACSGVVIEKYRDEGMEFLLQALNSGKFLEDVTGLSELQIAAEMTEVMTFSDDEDK